MKKTNHCVRRRGYATYRSWRRALVRELADRIDGTTLDYADTIVRTWERDGRHVYHYPRSWYEADDRPRDLVDYMM